MKFYASIVMILAKIDGALTITMKQAVVTLK